MQAMLLVLSSRFHVLGSVILLLLTSSLALAQDAKTLIELNGTTPKPALAKSWKKTKTGEYQFELDLTKELKKGVTVTPAAVKASLESKLSSQGVKALAVGSSAVKVTYTGDDKAFLSKIAATKIRATNVSLALESSVSEGGIRAKTLDRAAVAGEVKGMIVSTKADQITLKVRESKFDAINVNDRIKVKIDGTKHKVKEILFFMPEKQEGELWLPKAETVK